MDDQPNLTGCRSTAANETGHHSEASPQGSRWLLVALLAFVFVSAFFHVSDVDVGYHMRTGAHILEGNGIPAVNTFSHTTPEEPWLLHQWWPGLLYYAVYRTGGLGALITLKALIATTLMFLVWCAARQETSRHSLWPFWVVTFGVLIARVRFFERPDLISATLFALIVLLDRRYDNRRQWQWVALPLLMAFWANTHAGAMYGFVFLVVMAGTEWLEWGIRNYRRHECHGLAGALKQDWRQLLIRPTGGLISLAAAFVALELINPNGFKVLLVPIEQFSSSFWQSIIMEYQPPSWEGSKLFYISLGFLAVLQTVTWRRLNARLLLATLAFAWLACSSQRSMLVYTIVAAPYAASMLEQLRGIGRRLPRRIEQALLPVSWLLLAGLVILPNRTFLPGIGLYPAYYPMDVYRFIDTKVPPQNLFNDMRYGGSMAWWLYPRFKPFIDGRGDAYSVDFWKTAYLPAIHGEPVWPDIFEKYEVHGVLLAITQPTTVPKLAQILFAHPDWALVAYDDHTLLFLERTAANQPVIAENEFHLLWPNDWEFSAISPGNVEAAISEARRAVSTAPDSLFALTALARAWMVAGDHSAALEVYSLILQRPGMGANYWRDYGYCLFRAGRDDEADQVFSRMLRQRMLPGYAHYMKHFLALRRNDVSGADRHLAQALELEPGNSDYRAARLRLNERLSQ